ncbi:MAG: Spy/CpxP family protein refolding chaperone [Candidatus Binatia bacterium]|nr:Spy/CpxP family protein refolding chaperone [Candidatus Binatia bacterium]
MPPPPPMPPPPREGHLKRLIETLDLDAPTSAAVTDIIQAAETEHHELRRQLWEAHRRMRTLLQQETPDEAAIMAQAEVIGSLRTAVQKLRLRTMLQIRALLTPAQRQQLRERFSAQRPPRPRFSSPEGAPQRGEQQKGSPCDPGATDPHQ